MTNFNYRLSDQSGSLIELIAGVISRFRQTDFDKPVNAVELAYWLEGYRLGVRFIYDPEYPGYGQQPEVEGQVCRSETGDWATYVEHIDVNS